MAYQKRQNIKQDFKVGWKDYDVAVGVPMMAEHKVSKPVQEVKKWFPGEVKSKIKKEKG